MDSEDWIKYKRERKKKRHQNKEYSTNLLIREKIDFESFKEGDHLVITHNNKVIDFWPSTGKFIDRKTKKHRRGVKVLLLYLRS